MNPHTSNLSPRAVAASSRHGFLWVLLLAAGACAEPGSTVGAPVTVSDSAGVEIVSSHTPAWATTGAWEVSDTPSIRIGALDGPPELTLGNVRSVGWLPDGRIFAGDEQISSIRIFSAEGEPLARVGGEGDGPGELQWFLTVSPYRGDSLFVYDYRQRAVSVFGPDLSFARRFRSPLLEGNYWVQGSLDDGRFVLTSFGESRLSGGPGLVPDSSWVVVATPDGASVDTIGAFELGLRRVAESGMVEPPYLLPSTAVAIAGNRITWTAGARLEYTEIDPDGEVVRVVRIPHEPVPVTEAVVREFEDYYLDLGTGVADPGLADRVRESLRAAEYPRFLPATGSSVKIDAQGNRWVGRYNLTGPTPVVWEVFDRDGAWQGTLETPRGLEVHAIGEQEVIGVMRGEYDVPYIQVHALHR